MNKLLLAVLAFSINLAAQSGNEGATAPPRVTDLKWLAGCWGGQMKSGEFEECWTVPKAGLIQVSARRVGKEGTVNFIEFILVEDDADGVTMTVQHFGSRLAAEGQPVSFKLVKVNGAEAVFENPKHDHPQRIAYMKQADGSVISRISLLDGTKAVDFPMRRLGAPVKPINLSVQ